MAIGVLEEAWIKSSKEGMPFDVVIETFLRKYDPNASEVPTNGVDAFIKGYSIMDNPFPPGTSAEIQWRSEWKDRLHVESYLKR